MEKKLGDAELKVMQVLWRTGGCPARQVAEEMTAAWGWNANTTYTLLRRCVQKGAVRRTEPGFFCTPCVAQEEVQRKIRATDYICRRDTDRGASYYVLLTNTPRADAQHVIDRFAQSGVEAVCLNKRHGRQMREVYPTLFSGKDEGDA